MQVVTETANELTQELDLADADGILRLLRQADAQIWAGWREHPGLMDPPNLATCAAVSEVGRRRHCVCQTHTHTHTHNSLSLSLTHSLLSLTHSSLSLTHSFQLAGRLVQDNIAAGRAKNMIVFSGCGTSGRVVRTHSP